MNIIKKIYHETLCILGYERKVTTSTLGSSAIVKSEKMLDGKTKETVVKEATKPTKTVTYEKVPHSERHLTFKRLFKLNIWLEVALLAARAIAPGIERSIPNVYKFLDWVIVPILEWMAGVALNLVQLGMNLPFVQQILDILKGWAL